MNTRGWILAAGLVLAGAVAWGTASADIAWSGPGWYVEEITGLFDSVLLSGPYGSEASCNANKPADTNDASYLCAEENTDPDAAPP